MKRMFVAVAALALLCVVGKVSTEAYNWTEYRGHLYTLTTWGTWQECESAAVAAGGHLVAINDAEENAWVTAFAANCYSRNYQGSPNNQIAWIGYTNGAWSNGDPVAYTNRVSTWDSFTGVHGYILGGNYHAYPPYLPGVWGNNAVHDQSYAYNPQGVVEVVPDTTAPVMTSVSVTPPMVAAGDVVYVAVNATDNVGVTSVTANSTALTSSGGGNWTGGVVAASALGTHAVTVVARDAAGNNATDISQSYRTARVVAISNLGLADSVAAVASGGYQFMTWGRVTRIDSNTFQLDDGSCAPVRVVICGHELQTGNYACARGTWQVGGSPHILSCSNTNVARLN